MIREMECSMLFSLPKVLEIEDVSLPLVLERSKRKTLAIQVTCDVQLWVKAPLQMSEREINRFIQRKQFWIYKQAKRQLVNLEKKTLRSEEELQQLREQARVVLTAKTKAYAQQLGVCFQRIRIGNQRTRWGSCSSLGTISYNWKLILMPDEIIDYVVVHELCHRIEMNHSPKFWQLVAGILPDYALRREWLKQHGNEY